MASTKFSTSFTVSASICSPSESTLALYVGSFHSKHASSQLNSACVLQSFNAMITHLYTLNYTPLVMFPAHIPENLGQVIPGHLLDFEAVEYVLAGQFCLQQINKKKQFLLQSRRNIYTLGHHDTSLYLLFRSPLIGVIILKVRESRPHMRLLQDHQCFGVPIFRFRITHRSQKCHTVRLIVADSVFGVDEPPEPCLKSVERAQIHNTVGENCTYCILFRLLAIYHEVPHFNITFVPPLAQNL